MQAGMDCCDSAIFNESAATSVLRGCFVVYDSTNTGVESKVKLPAAALAIGVAGCIDAVSASGGEVVSFCKEGRCFCKSDGSGALTPGTKLVIADSQGRVKAKPGGAITDPFDIVGTVVEYAPATADVLFVADVETNEEYTS